MKDDKSKYWNKYYDKIKAENLMWFSEKDLEKISQKYKIKPDFARFIWRWTEHSVRTFELLEINNGDKVLEVGCGSGGFSAPLILRNLEKKFDFTAIDYSDVGINATQSRLKHLGLADRCQVKLADILKLPFPDNSFDKIIYPSVIEHIPDQEKAIEEMRRVCKKNGEILISTDNQPGWVGKIGMWLCIEKVVNFLKTLRIIKRKKGYFIANTAKEFRRKLEKYHLHVSHFEFTHFSIPFSGTFFRLNALLPFLQGINLKLLTFIEKKSRSSHQGRFHAMFIFICKK